MAEREQRSQFEGFEELRVVQEGLERRGYYLQAVEKEHSEGLITEPLLAKLRTTIKKRGFEKVSGHAALTFSGYRNDPREIYEIPAIHAYYQTLDRQLPELPALLTWLPELAYNGPRNHLTLLGTIAAAIPRADFPGYDVAVLGATPIVDDAVSRIRQAGRKYHLREGAVANLVEGFRRAALYRRPQS